LLKDILRALGEWRAAFIYHMLNYGIDQETGSNDFSLGRADIALKEVALSCSNLRDIGNSEIPNGLDNAVFDGVRDARIISHLYHVVGFNSAVSASRLPSPVFLCDGISKEAAGNHFNFFRRQVSIEPINLYDADIHHGMNTKVLDIFGEA
jgi:hypothetical protein